MFVTMMTVLFKQIYIAHEDDKILLVAIYIQVNNRSSYSYNGQIVVSPIWHSPFTYLHYFRLLYILSSIKSNNSVLACSFPSCSSISVVSS